jgi:alkylation response protein AidB-like acyl-CoA dehydrogenase
MSDDSEQFGSKTAFAEPSWYTKSKPSPYYNEHHVAFRATMRKFVDEEIIPHVDEWELAQDIPAAVYKRASEVGLLQATVGWPSDFVPGLDAQPAGYDVMFSIIAQDELCRCASGGVVWGLTGGLGIGLPPVVYYGTDKMKREVGLPCLRGEKRIALAVSEPHAGSDVAGLRTTAEDKGDHYLLNGQKKWITCGMFADYFTVAARTGEEGMMGIELLLVPRDLPGVSTRPMDCMGVKGSGTAFVEFEDVKVPKDNLIGDVTCLLRNFVTERLGIAIQANRFARVCLQESIEYAKRRKAFGKKLEEQPVVRHRIAEMMREVEVTHAFIEGLAFRIQSMQSRGEDWFDGILKLGAEAALAKVQATKTFDHCARSAAHLQGGSAYVKGNKVESLYRHVLSLAIPGGSEDVMIDAAARLALKGRL